MIYPGEGSEKKIFQKYHEILPGVGAFPVRPSSESGAKAEGIDAVKSFIEDVIKHQENKYSDYYRINYWINESVVREDCAEYICANDVPPADQYAAVIPVRSQVVFNRSVELGFFYCHAEYENGKPCGANTSLLKAHYVLPVQMDDNSPYGKLYKITGIDIVSKEELIHELGSGFSKGTASRYYRFFFEEVIDFTASYRLRRKGFPEIISIYALSK